ncbi:MAG TPA: elongation factor Ts, partial [Anaerolineae bacterium]|nr:elongation factor Ts [Anaerolineae bacterium]
ELREATGAGVLDCKNALQESGGDFDKAVEYLGQKGLAAAAKRANRAANEGTIGSYVHAGSRVAALVEVNCETDFVARTDDFLALAHDLAMQVVATKPKYLHPEDIPAEIIEAEKEIYRAQMEDSGKPEHVIDKIVEGKLQKYYQEVCLMQQPFIKDEGVIVQDMVTQVAAKLGENIVVRRFVRFELGEEIGDLRPGSGQATVP